MPTSTGAWVPAPTFDDPVPAATVAYPDTLVRSFPRRRAAGGPGVAALPPGGPDGPPVPGPAPVAVVGRAGPSAWAGSGS